MAPLLHIVALRFREDLDSDFITDHFIKDVRLDTRMPELVKSFTFHRNVSLLDRADVNGGCSWVVMSTLFDESMLKTYLEHPEHRDVGRIQTPLLTGKFVLDVVV